MDKWNTELSLTQTHYEHFRDLIQERSGLHFPEDRRRILTRGLAEALSLSSCANLDEYYSLLQTRSSTDGEWDRLVNTLTVGETYFFRNKGHFDALANHVLPEIIAQRQGSNRHIRIWSAGCATGEEPYSVAILLRELISNIQRWNILILATDINRDVLRKAGAGLYGPWSFRGVERHIQNTYFSFNGRNHYAIVDEIKRMVAFNHLNLIGDYYPSLANDTHGMDVILCRNVTIYFSPEETEKVVGRFYKCLVAGGWLVPGASEPDMTTYQDFEPRNFPGAVVYQKLESAKAKAEPKPAFEPWKPVVEPPAPMVESPKPESGLALSVPPPPPPDPYQAAVELLAAGQVDEALAKLYEKLDQDADFGPTYYALSKAYANKGHLKEAQHWCERAIEKDKLHPKPYYTLSMIYQEYGLLDKAVDVLNKALYLDPMFLLAHYGLACVYLRQGNKKLACKSLRNVQRLLEGRPREEPIPEGDGLVVGRLLQLVEKALAALANGA